MNAVEIEQAVSNLCAAPFVAAEFPFAFLAAFGNKETTLKRLRVGGTNKSDIDGLLQVNNIHIKVCAAGEVNTTLRQLRQSRATQRHKAKFILATDGEKLEAEDLKGGDVVVCDYADFPNHFAFFLPLSGIFVTKQIRDNPFDIRATSRLNKLYLELIKDNRDWAQDVHAMNHFVARLIFCFFAEDTDIFNGNNLFTNTVEQMSSGSDGDAQFVIGEIFRAMNVPIKDRGQAQLPRWADAFPYVNGGLFAGNIEVPRFSRNARSYLLNIGALDWRQINPDIFGSMIQAVADEEERGALGMHYTSVPNILKVLKPLFLDALEQQLKQAGDNRRKLLNLRQRLAGIRVFDPACGSGNFLVIAYKILRELEQQVNERLGEAGRKSVIHLTNFRGIELRDFSAEIARLALIIAEYQCDVRYRGQKEAFAEFLPLSAENWIIGGNALELDWLALCPPVGSGVKLLGDDLFATPLDQAEIDFKNAGGEVYICGNPPYRGSTWQSKEQKADVQRVFGKRTKKWKSLDYVCGWFMKATDYCQHAPATAAFVTTNSICQGEHVPILWPLIFNNGCKIAFAHTSFKWANLAAHNAGVTVAIIGISKQAPNPRRLFALNENGETTEQECANINAYLVAGANVIVDKSARPLGQQAGMTKGNQPTDGGHLLLALREVDGLELTQKQAERFIRPIYGSAEFIRGLLRYCLWIKDEDLAEALAIPAITQRIEKVRQMRLASSRSSTVNAATTAYRFAEIRQTGNETAIIIPGISSENRPYLPVGLLAEGSIVSNLAFAIYDAPLWNLALIASRLHLVWIGAVCGKLKTDFRYSNTLGWNTFPLPFLTSKNKEDLTRCAEDILLAQDAHFPATIADLYAEGQMPDDLMAAHGRNDEVVERIFAGRRFKNDAERLEQLFRMYVQMKDESSRRSPEIADQTRNL